MRHSLMAKECKSMQGTPGLSREHGLATASATPVVNSRQTTLNPRISCQSNHPLAVIAEKPFRATGAERRFADDAELFAEGST